MLALAISYFTSAVTVFFKDMSQIVGICLQFGMWMVPIMWAVEMFPSAPSWLEQVLKINPVYYIVVGYRDSMLRKLVLGKANADHIFLGCDNCTDAVRAEGI